MISYRIKLIMMFCVIGFIGCCPHRLTVQTQILNEEYLASYTVGTPDPRIECPDIGERLLIQWSLTSCQFKERNLMLFLKVRFRNHQEKEIQVPIQERRGVYLYNLINEDYCQSGGILTYVTEIRSQEGIVACWKHPLWTELITFEN
jgi:hypothetical protein